MNQVYFIGRLAKAPVVKYSQSGKCVCTFSLAVNRDFKNAEGKYDADFFNVVVWGKLAELVGNSADKGHKVLTRGRLQNRSYEKDGLKRYITELIADKVEFLEKKEQPKTMSDMGKDVPFDEEVQF